MSELKRMFVDIKHEFTKAELAKLGITLAEQDALIDDAKAEHKEIKSNMNAEVKAMEDVSKELYGKINKKFEINKTDCRLRLNLETSTREYLAIKSDKILHTEPFRDEDFQTEIDVGDTE